MKARAAPEKKSGAGVLAVRRKGPLGVIPAKVRLRQTKFTGRRKSVDKALGARVPKMWAGAASPGHGQDDTRGTTSEDFTLMVEDVQQLQILRKGLIVVTSASSHIINDWTWFKNFDSTFKPERHSM